MSRLDTAAYLAALMTLIACVVAIVVLMMRWAQ